MNVVGGGSTARPSNAAVQLLPDLIRSLRHEAAPLLRHLEQQSSASALCSTYILEMVPALIRLDAVLTEEEREVYVRALNKLVDHHRAQLRRVVELRKAVEANAAFIATLSERISVLHAITTHPSLLTRLAHSAPSSAVSPQPSIAHRRQVKKEGWRTLFGPPPPTHVATDSSSEFGGDDHLNATTSTTNTNTNTHGLAELPSPICALLLGTATSAEIAAFVRLLERRSAHALGQEDGAANVRLARAAVLSSIPGALGVLVERLLHGAEDLHSWRMEVEETTPPSPPPPTTPADAATSSTSAPYPPAMFHHMKIYWPGMRNYATTILGIAQEAARLASCNNNNNNNNHGGGASFFSPEEASGVFDRANNGGSLNTFSVMEAESQQQHGGVPSSWAFVMGSAGLHNGSFRAAEHHETPLLQPLADLAMYAQLPEVGPLVEDGEAEVRAVDVVLHVVSRACQRMLRREDGSLVLTATTTTPAATHSRVAATPTVGGGAEQDWMGSFITATGSSVGFISPIIPTSFTGGSLEDVMSSGVDDSSTTFSPQLSAQPTSLSLSAAAALRNNNNFAFPEDSTTSQPRATTRTSHSPPPPHHAASASMPGLTVFMKEELEEVRRAMEESCATLRSMEAQLRTELTLILFRVLSSVLDWLIPAIYVVSPRLLIFYRKWVCDVFRLLYEEGELDHLAQLLDAINGGGAAAAAASSSPPPATAGAQAATAESATPTRTQPTRGAKTSNNSGSRAGLGKKHAKPPMSSKSGAGKGGSSSDVVLAVDRTSPTPPPTPQMNQTPNVNAVADDHLDATTTSMDTLTMAEVEDPRALMVPGSNARLMEDLAPPHNTTTPTSSSSALSLVQALLLSGVAVPPPRTYLLTRQIAAALGGLEGEAVRAMLMLVGEPHAPPAERMAMMMEEAKVAANRSNTMRAGRGSATSTSPVAAPPPSSSSSHVARGGHLHPHHRGGSSGPKPPRSPSNNTVIDTTPALAHHHRFRYPNIRNAHDLVRLYISTVEEAEQLLSPHDPIRAALIQNAADFLASDGVGESHTALELVEHYMMDVEEERVQLPVWVTNAPNAAGEVPAWWAAGSSSTAATASANVATTGSDGAAPHRGFSVSTASNRPRNVGGAAATSSVVAVDASSAYGVRGAPPSPPPSTQQHPHGTTTMAAHVAIPMVLPSWSSPSERDAFVQLLAVLRDTQRRLQGHASAGDVAEGGSVEMHPTHA